MISTGDLAIATWRPILEMGGCTFLQCVEYPDLYRRDRYVDERRAAGGIEVRWSCDDDVVATLGDAAAHLNRLALDG